MNKLVIILVKAPFVLPNKNFVKLPKFPQKEARNYEEACCLPIQSTQTSNRHG